jgi:hypothetical protein
MRAPPFKCNDIRIRTVTLEQNIRVYNNFWEPSASCVYHLFQHTKTRTVYFIWFSALVFLNSIALQIFIANTQCVSCGVRNEFLYIWKKISLRRGPPRVEAGSNTSTVTLWVVGGDEKGSLKCETVKYGRETQGARTKERLRWQRPAAYIKVRPVLSSERAPHKEKKP